VKTLLLVIALAAPAVAAEPLDDAKQAFAAGKIAFEQNDFENALKQFLRANELVPAPSLQFNIGSCYERLGRYHDAVVAFEKFLETAGEPQSDEERAFRQELRNRVSANKLLPDRKPEQTLPPEPAPEPAQPQPAQPMQQPPPQPQPGPMPPPYPPIYYQPVPYSNANGYMPLLVPMSREQRLTAAKQKRTKGIIAFSVGMALFVGGAALVAVSTGPGYDLGSSDGVVGWTEVIIGSMCLAAGTATLIPGAVNWGRGQSEINALAAPEPKHAGVMLSSPVFRF
jgi:hypothetical protein